jgi:hypothetical protein
VNFSRLLTVNQGGAQRMADSLANNAQQKGQQAAGNIASASASVGQKVAAGTNTYEKAAPQALGNGSDPNAFREAGRLSGVRSTQGYTGPKDWAGAGVDTGALSTQAREASEAAKGLTTAGGRGAQLRQQAGGPYSAGMSALDAGLSGAALGSRGRDLASLYGGLSQQLIDARAATDTAVGAATTASQEASGKYAADQVEFNTQADQLAAQQEAQAAEAERIRQNQATYDTLMSRPRYNRLAGVRLSRKG